MTLQAINPLTGQVIEAVQEHSLLEVEKKLQHTHTTFEQWKNTTFSYRAALMKKAATILRAKKEHLAAIAAKEMGKPITQGEAEVEKSALACDFYADNAEKFLTPELVATDASKSYVRYDPLGAILAVMPWNYPFWQVFRFAAPALMAGNVGVLKHASNVPRCAIEIENVFIEAGFPPGVFTTLLISSSAVDAVVGDPVVKAVALTGSDKAGRHVAALAGKHLKKCVLELGGSDPFIVLADADLPTCATMAAMARLNNSGQSCIAAKRFIVVKERLAEFETALVKATQEKIIGDPLRRETQIGPLARVDLMNELDAQVQNSITKGAKLLCGGKPTGQGAFYPPTVLTNVHKGMPAYDEELFGPVAAIITANDEEDALHIANDTPFGLGASIWTTDTAKAEKLATRIDAGSVFINGIVKSDPRLPFGGIKDSGYGRELSYQGIREFVNVKTVWIH